MQVGERGTDGMQVGDGQTDGMQDGDRRTDGMQAGDRRTDGMQAGDRRTDGMQAGDRWTDGMQAGDRRTDGMLAGDTALIVDCAGSDLDVVVIVPRSWPDKSRLILQKYFQSRRKSCGGECDVIGVDERTYRVTFRQKEDKQNVLRRVKSAIEVDGRTLGIEIRSDRQSGTADRDGACRPKLTERTDDGGRPKRAGEPTGFSRNNPQEIFTRVSVTLNADSFTTELIRGMLEKFPSLRVTKESPLRIEEVTGTFPEIEKLHKYFCQRVLEETPARRWDRNVSLPTALYEYFSEVYSEDIDRIKREWKVEVERMDEPTDCTKITITSGESDSCTEGAQQAVSDIIQKITWDWDQAVARPPLQKILSDRDFTLRLRKRFPKTLPIVHRDTVTLRGPAAEVLLARNFIEAGGKNSAPFPNPVTINSSTAADLTVRARHLEIVKRLRSAEMREIEQKYNVTMEETASGPTEVRLRFGRAGGRLDLGAHASQIFLSLLQATIAEAGGRDFKGRILPEGTDIKAKRSGQEAPTTLNDDSNSSRPPGGSHLADGAPGEKPMDAGGEEESAGGEEESAGGGEESAGGEEESCPVCLDSFTDREVLPKCSHAFCKTCLETCMASKPVCPVCNVAYGAVTGTQPDGTMKCTVLPSPLPGYRGQTIQITYVIPSGTQGPNHPNPGGRFQGTSRTAYLPDNHEGREILLLLKKAFNQKLIFTIGESRTTGATDCVTWNDIHHKTNTRGGPSNFGYPDPEYLKRVRDELKAKGIE